MRRILCCLLVALASCANISVKPVKNDYGSVGINAKGASGVRFYRPAPHVWLTVTGPSEKVNISVDQTKDGDKTTTNTVSIAEPGYTANLVWLPDYSQEFIVQWKAGIGTIKPEIALADGWNLTSLAASVDPGFKASGDAISSIATAFGGFLADPEMGFKGAGLYRLKPASDGSLSLGKRVVALD